MEKADAIFVLGGSSVYVERTQKAAELFKNGVSEKILLTDDGTRGGWSKLEKRNPPFAELAKNELVKLGVPAENIEILQPPVTGTIYEARNLAEAVKTKNLNSVLIVTSAYHSRRAFWICDKILKENNSRYFARRSFARNRDRHAAAANVVADAERLGICRGRICEKSCVLGVLLNEINLGIIRLASITREYR